MVTFWFLMLSVYGLNFITVEPFNSEEACILAARMIGAQPEQYTCNRRDYPAQQPQ